MPGFPELARSCVSSILPTVRSVSDDHDRLDNTKREGKKIHVFFDPLPPYPTTPRYRFHRFSIMGARDVHRRCKISFREFPPYA